MNNIQNMLRSATLQTGALPSELKLTESGRYETYYAPFEHINTNARLVICGITPGVQQAEIALRTAQEGLQRGLSWEGALHEAKNSASFAGAMRNNLALMLDYIGLQRYLGIDSCSELFGTHRHLVHYTSALRNPVLDSGKNYSGGPSLTANTYLWSQVLSGLKEEIAALSEDALFIPLGAGVDEVFRRLIELDLLSPERVLFGLPHASGANAERIAYFCEKKERSSLSSKTNPETIEARRKSLVDHVARLTGLAASVEPQVPAGEAIVVNPKKPERRAQRMEYRVTRGKYAGSILTPHQYADGSYVVSKTRFEEDQIRVTSLDEVKHYLDRGYALRMSDPLTKRGPSLIKPASITFIDP